jgi:hypothetical protein
MVSGRRSGGHLKLLRKRSSGFSLCGILNSKFSNNQLSTDLSLCYCITQFQGFASGQIRLQACNRNRNISILEDFFIKGLI